MGQIIVAFSEYLKFTINFIIEGASLLFCISTVFAYIGLESFHSISPDCLNNETGKGKNIILNSKIYSSISSCLEQWMIQKQCNYFWKTWSLRIMVSS